MYTKEISKQTCQISSNKLDARCEKAFQKSQQWNKYYRPEIRTRQATIYNSKASKLNDSDIFHKVLMFLKNSSPVEIKKKPIDRAEAV